MSLKTFLISTLLAGAAVATSQDTSNSYGAGGAGGAGGSGGQGGGEWSSWGGDKSPAPPASAPPMPAVSMPPSGGAQPSCPSGCFPIPPTCSAPPPPPPAMNGQMIVQVVSVADANGSLKYFPNNVQAPVGSIVQFQFHPKNHTITESSFAEPCKPVGANVSTATRPGIKSGFIPVMGTENFTPVYNVLVNDTKPIWIFCGQTNHCQKGMAMVINQAANTPNTIEKYIENAGKLALASVAPPAATGSAPPPPPPPPPPPATSATFTFGGGAPPPPAQTSAVAAPPPAVVPPPAGSSAAGAPPAPIATLATSAGLAPATFTGAASSLNVRDASSFAGVVIGAVAAALL